MLKKDLIESFTSQQGQYKRLGANLEQAIKSFLESEEISHLNVYHRIKEFDSFFEKIDRKKYENPFEEIEDICGVRIICYYASDINKIEEIIKREFKVLETQDKSESLGLKEFAYRSVHYIVQIKDTWLATPNYRGLENLKAEIQIRTILMHAWAEIEHKLNYKNDAQVPFKFQRKLFRLSAKFEEADEQFEELRDGINSYKNNITLKAKSENKFETSQDFNKDSFSAYLNFHFPDIPLSEDRFLNEMFDQLVLKRIGFQDLETILDKFKPHFVEIASDLQKSGYRNDVLRLPSELIGFALQVIGVDEHLHTMDSWKTVVEKWKGKIQ